MDWLERVANDPQGSIDRLADRHGLSTSELDDRHRRIAGELGTDVHLSINELIQYRDTPKNTPEQLIFHLKSCKYCRDLSGAITLKNSKIRTTEVIDDVHSWEETEAYDVGSDNSHGSLAISMSKGLSLIGVIGCCIFTWSLFGNTSKLQTNRLALIENSTVHSSVNPNAPEMTTVMTAMTAIEVNDTDTNLKSAAFGNTSKLQTNRLALIENSTVDSSVNPNAPEVTTVMTAMTAVEVDDTDTNLESAASLMLNQVREQNTTHNDGLDKIEESI